MKQGYVFNRTGFLFLLFTISSTFVFSQQFYVNSEWAANAGNDTSQYFYKRATVKTDNNSNVYTLGSAITTTGHDFLLMKQNSGGDTLYIVQWNGDGDGEDRAIDMYVDPSTEYVYIVGGSIQDTTGADSLDAVILAYDDTGAELWHTYLAGSNSYNDIYTSIATDGSNYLVAVGTIGSASTSYDYLITTFDFSGNELYGANYDYANYKDVAVKVVYDPISNYFMVAGASQPTDTTWDYYILEYKYNGSYGDYYRNYAGTGATHRPTDAVFVNNQYYVTGGIRTPGGDYDIKTVVMDTTLTVIWEQTWDGADGMDDISHSIKVDGDGNVYVTGNTGMSNWTTNMVTIKYDPSGNEKFVNYFGQYNNASDGAHDLEIFEDNIYVTGYVVNGSNYCTINYDTAGTYKWSHLSPAGYTYPTDMAIDQMGNPIISAPLLIGLLTEKLTVLELNPTAAVDTAGDPLFVENQVLIKFNPSVVKDRAVDDKGKIFGNIKDFIQDTTISKLNSLLGFDLSTTDSVHVIKVYKRMTTDDTLSIGRAGDSIQVPKFWSMLLVTMPPGVTIDTLLFDTLASLAPDIYYATYNNAYKLFSTPNDVEYDEQECFHPTTTYPNGHINMEPAWDYEVGNSQVRIGVYDSGIFFPHPDFGGGLGVGAVGGGYDYVEDQPLGWGTVSPDDQGHGTACGGVIGAVRNNSLGIAGGAGGNDSAGVDGVKLYGMKIYNDALEWISAADQFDAWFEGASSFGYNLNGMSLSYGQAAGTNYALHEAMRYVYDNDVFFMAARGNDNVNSTQIVMPSCEKDEFVINVGGSGTNGSLKISSNCDTVITQDQNNLSLYGLGVDVIAPATTALVRSVDNTYSNNYVYFNGTSAATPLTAGVAGLMISNYDGQLFPEDIEYFLERFAKDKGAPGYQDSTGWGLVDAGAVMDSIHRPQFDVLHFNYSTQPSTSISTTGAGYGISMYVFNSNYGLLPGTYYGDWYEITATIYHTLPAGASIIDAWERNSDSKGWWNSNSFGGVDNYDTKVYLDTITPTYARMHTYFYFLDEYYNGTLYNVDQWVPFDPGIISNRQFAYSVYVTNPTIGIEELENDLSMTVYPNPSDNHVNILFKFDKEREAGFKLYDMAGRVIISTNDISYPAGDNLFQIDVSSLSSGLYILQMNSGNTHIQKKIIVN